MAKVILHIDLNAFFASAMQIKYPHLIGKPLAVCSNARGSVVTTASYEARAYGVKSAMPLAIAKQKCPDLEVVETDFEWFNNLSLQFVNLLKTYTPLVEKASIDECYLDVTQKIKTYKKPLNLVVEIQQDIKESLGLQCSIGLAPNKFLAKMASDMKKPNGITILRKREIQQKLWPLPVGSMVYVGQKMTAKLKKAEIHTIGDLANSNLQDLIPLLGNQAYIVHQRAWGEDQDPVVVEHDVKSISASQSLYDPIMEYDEVSLLIKTLVDDIAAKCKKNQISGKTLTLSLKLEDGTILTKSKRNDEGYSIATELYQVGMLLFDLVDQQEPIKFISISLMNLEQQEYDAIYNLFSMNSINDVDDIIKTTNNLLGKNVLIKANELKGKSPDETDNQ
ncbi:MAG: DNA polymerase IV [Erysipelothrix sp.]|nr:DNA polymerase IV [Erysipelothrix sp.]